MNLVQKLKEKKKGELLITDYCSEQVRRTLKKYIGNKDGKILELGCGPGDFISLLN